MLQPVKYKNTVDIAIEHIGNYIAKNLNIGDVLPSERNLAEQYQRSSSAFPHTRDHRIKTENRGGSRTIAPR